MSQLATVSPPFGTRRTSRDEVAGWLAGAGFTFALFFCLAHFEDFGARELPPEITDLRAVSLPFEPPPPPPATESAPAAEEAAPLVGIEPGASESPIHLAVVPRELEAFVPPAPVAPRAVVPFALLHTEFKPRTQLEVDVRHVYQSSEVDQPPQALVRAAPVVPPELFGRASSLRVLLLLTIGVTGRVEAIRVAESSGNRTYDALVMSTVREAWEFSPAIRRGKRVRCLAQQSFRVHLPGGSPFELP